MKHRKRGRQFGRIRAQRVALLRSLTGSLIMHERIETTQAKAKELCSHVDRIITRAKRADDTVQIVRKLEGIVPLMAIKKLSGGFLKKLDKRTSGYTRVVKLPARKSDGADMAIIEFVDSDDIKKEKKEDVVEAQKVEEKTKA